MSYNSDIYFFNTASSSKELFVPYNANNIGMYVCGPTVYDDIHIGNARPLVMFDIVHRLLRFHYNNNVTFVRNITDIDDKINKRAYERNITIETLTTDTTKDFRAICDKLYCLPPTTEPCATDHIDDMLALINQLITRGHAYEAEGHVLFDVTSMNNYGLFAKKSLDDLIEGARVEVAPFKRSPADFVLWKPSNESTPGWESPYGYGRPGWHIECSAMSLRYLGKNFDIHAGGLDLIFPHHQNEIAQSCCAFDDANFAQYWLHNGYVTIDDEKMSKSLGNFITVKNLLERYHGETIRLSLLMTHYRQPLNFSETRLNAAQTILNKLYRHMQTMPNIAIETINNANISPIINALNDDVNTPKAITIWQEWFKNEEYIAQAIKTAQFLGLCNNNPQSWFQHGGVSDAGDVIDIDALIAQRNLARQQKNWAMADDIRDTLLAHNIILEDSDGLTTWRKK